MLKTVVPKNIDTITIAETKIDNTFTTSQFMVDGFIKPFRRDRNKNCGGLLTFVRDGIPVKEICSHTFPHEIEVIVIELIVKKQKWLLLNLYRPPSQCSKFFFNGIEKGLDFYSNKYQKFILIEDLNCEPVDCVIREFMDSYGLKKIVKDPTCFKSNETRCIDLRLTNGKEILKIQQQLKRGYLTFIAWSLQR